MVKTKPVKKVSNLKPKYKVDIIAWDTGKTNENPFVSKSNANRFISTYTDDTWVWRSYLKDAYMPSLAQWHCKKLQTSLVLRKA